MAAGPPLENRFLVAVADALTSTMDQSDWTRFALLHDLERQITEHPRFLRSLHFGDDDYGAHVLGLVQELYNSEDRTIFDELLNEQKVQRWLKRNKRELLAEWTQANKDEPDQLVEAISHSLNEVEATKQIADLSTHIEDIKAALPGNPRHAVGATKELVEAAMRTILTRTGVNGVEDLDFAALATRCFTELGLTGTSQPTSNVDGKVRRIANKAREMLITANELRNLAGSGHGKAAGTEEKIDPIDAGMIASIGMVVAAWLMRKSES